MKKGSDVSIRFSRQNLFSDVPLPLPNPKKRTAHNERFFLLTRTGIEPMLPP